LLSNYPPRKSFEDNLAMSDDGDEHGGSYAIFFAEGEVLYKQGQYDKAIECFSKVSLSFFRS